MQCKPAGGKVVLVLQGLQQQSVQLFGHWL
jgi:hypothetical protein